MYVIPKLSNNAEDQPFLIVKQKFLFYVFAKEKHVLFQRNAIVLHYNLIEVLSNERNFSVVQECDFIQSFTQAFC